MDGEKLPIKFFAPREIDELRIEGLGGTEKPQWVLTGKELENRAKILKDSLDGIEEIMVEKKKRFSTMPFSFVAKIHEDATAKSKRKYITNFFQVKDHSSVIGVSDINKLIVSLDTIEELQQISNRLIEYQNNDYAISCLEGFTEFTPDINTVEEVCNYKVKLVDYQNYEQNLAIRRMFESALTRNNVEYKRTNYSEKLFVYNMKNIQTDIFHIIHK